MKTTGRKSCCREARPFTAKEAKAFARRVGDLVRQGWQIPPEGLSPSSPEPEPPRTPPNPGDEPS